MKRRANLLAAVAIGAMFVMVGPASAEIRTGTASDPVGDSGGAPSQDFTSVTAHYDTNGQAGVTATMNGPIAGGPPSFFSFSVASYTPPSSCTGATLSLFGFTDSAEHLFMVTGYSGTGSSGTVVNGNSITFGASGTALQGKDWSCVTATVTPKGSGGTVLDQLNTPLYFKGYGPDTDGDGLKDSEDQCPTAAGSAPTGCPASASTPSCVPPKLKGKTLKQAKSAIRNAHCLLGKVVKPKHASKKVKLVVVKQKQHGNKIDITLGAKKHK